MVDYPGSIFSQRTIENKPGVTYDETKTTIGFAEDVTNLGDEITALENELGTDPSRSYSDVKARLDALRKVAITFIIDGGGSAITTGEKGHLRIPFKCEIQKATLLADQSGSIQIDIWKDTYANHPPTDADSITASAPPSISTGVKDEDDTLTGWTTTISADDILAFNVDSIDTIERVTIILEVNKIA